MDALALARFEHEIRGPLSRILGPKKFVELYSASRPWFLDMLATTNPKVEAPRSEVKAFGLKFRNDLGNAAGLDKDGGLLPFNYLVGAGFDVVGTVLDEPNSGNLIDTFGRKANPWTPLHYSESALNTLGLPSHGIDEVIQTVNDFKQQYQPVDFPIIVSVMEHPNPRKISKLESLVRCFGKALTVADGIEVNISCPNVAHREEEQELIEKLHILKAARDEYFAKTSKYVPIFVKMRDFGDIPHTVELMTQLGMDGLVGVNSQIDYSRLRKYIDKRDAPLFDYYTTTYKGGVTGKAIQTFAQEQITSAAREIKKQHSPLKLIHVGGIGTPFEMSDSRAINQLIDQPADKPVVILREWYTRMFKRMSITSTERVYKSMVAP